MILRRRIAAFLALALVIAPGLGGCAGAPGRIPSAAAQPAPPMAAAAPADSPARDWAFEGSDLPPDPEFRFIRLDNGMRVIVRRNATPPGTALVRLNIATGSLHERADERGFAHFVEHMAFNGSTSVPEGEMVRLLERSGLSFGADTNAQTSFEHTTYMLDLPRSDPALLDTALMLMRETASELTFSPDAVARERGVVLAELRDGQGWQRASLEAQLAFFHPDATYRQRLPIGTIATLEAATAPALRAFWEREYVPEKATLIVVGDFDPEAVEEAVRQRFSDWRARTATPRPDEGRIDPGQKRASTVYLDPSLSERVTVSRHGPWLGQPDSAEERRRALLRQIGYGAMNRRFQRMSRLIDPPFRGAGLGTSEVFRIGRTTNLIVDTVDGGWERGLAAAASAYARALDRGFTQAEIDEQVANIRTALENAASGAQTRPHAALVTAALALVRDEQVPTTPQSGLERFNRYSGSITPQAVLAELRRELVPLADPLIRFQGRRSPKGGAKALRSAWNRALRARTSAEEPPPSAPFAYENFGPPGRVVADVLEPHFRIRQVRFANNVLLNLKYSSLAQDRVEVRINLDGGRMLDSRDNPLATELVSSLPRGGLGQHSEDDLQTLLAGRSVSLGLGTTGDTFATGTTTTPRDLALQLQLWAALLTDPGYRREGEVLYRQNIVNSFARLRSSPGAALGNQIGAILSDGDPRFTLQALDRYTALTFDKLRADIGERLRHGAIEIAVVGDIDESAVIDAVARTFGALPEREAGFRDYAAQRERPFTARRGPVILRHAGERNQAIVRHVWPTRDDSDLEETVTLALLAEVAGIELIETLREKLGKAYSPAAASSPSRVWRGYGTFTMNASVDLADVLAVRAALDETARQLMDSPIDADLLRRARAPMIERMENALKTNAGWMSLVERAQGDPASLVRARRAKAVLESLLPADLQAAARRYLSPGQAVQLVVVHDEAALPPELAGAEPGVPQH
ncbi:MAG: M16 family metallopeptidase [Novosphingobium sp.]